MEITGWMERRALFYGFYQNRRYSVRTPGGASDIFHYNMPLAYICVTLSIFLLSLVLMVSNTAQSTRENLLSRKGKHTVYCGVVFGGWDYSLESTDAISLKYKSIYKEVSGKLQEARDSQRRSNRKGAEMVKVILIRILLNFAIVVLLLSAGAFIVYVTIASQQFTEREDYESVSHLLRLLVEYVPSLTITFLGVCIPPVMVKIVLIEDYHTETSLRLTLLRTVILRMASLAVLLATIYAQVTCKEHRDECNVGFDKCPTLPCWETYVGQQIYKLVVMDFLVNLLSVLLVDFPRKMIGRMWDYKITQMIGLVQFDVPKYVLDLVYGQALCWLGVFFSPLIPAICVMKNFIIFYLKKVTLLRNCTPSAEPYRASRSNMFFVVILLAAYIACCLPVAYVIWTLEPSHGCGPFRLYKNDYEILSITINTFPVLTRTICDVLFSPAFFCIALIIVIMMLYYSRQIIAVHKEIERVMANKLALEHKDKHFLLERIMELSKTEKASASSVPEIPTDRTAQA